jgi:hypothetical protein
VNLNGYCLFDPRRLLPVGSRDALDFPFDRSGALRVEAGIRRRR